MDNSPLSQHQVESSAATLAIFFIRLLVGNPVVSAEENLPELMNRKTAIDQYGMKPTTFDRRVDNGDIKAYQDEQGTPWFKRSDLNRYVKNLKRRN